MSRPSQKDKIILTGASGSRSYGTSTSESDFDFMSFVVPAPDLYLGLATWGNSGTMTDDYDSPEGEHVEHQYFEIKKVMQLCSNFNPNVIPLLWINPEHYEVMTEEGSLLIQNRTLFNSKKAFDTFCGYASGQLQKMGGVFNDEENSNKALKSGYERFQRLASSEIEYQRLLRDEDAEDDRYDEGFLNALLALNAQAKEQVKSIPIGPVTGRMGKKRKELRDKYGFDVKFGYHVIRLMRMCVEFLKHPEDGLKVCRTGIDAEFLYSIREGKLTKDEIKAMADELLAEAKEALKKTELPDEPDRERINELTIEIVRRVITA